MALSMDEERMLAEIERRLADDDPVLAARLTSFRLPRLALGPRSARARLTASLLMLMVVAAISVFVYTLMPFRGQPVGNTIAHTGPAQPTMSATAAGTSPVMRPASTALRSSTHAARPAAGHGRSSPGASSSAHGK